MTTEPEWSPTLHLKRWLGRHQAGCLFVARLAMKDRTRLHELFEAPCAEDFTTIDDAIEAESDEDGRAVVFFWPRAGATADVANLLRLLARLERWSVERVGWGGALEERVCFSVRWRTKTGALTEVAGFAPLPEMPLTRRAPYLAIALWGGAGRPGARAVGLVDTPWRRDARTDPLWAGSVRLTEQMLPGEDRERLRRVAFCLPRGEAAGVEDLQVREDAKAPPSKNPPAV